MIVEDMDQYLKENRFRLRNEVSTIADFYKSTSQDFIVHCEVREGKTPLIQLDLSVPDKEQAEAMCSKMERKKPGNLRVCHENAYEYVIGGIL